MNSVTIAVVITREHAGQCNLTIARGGAGDDIVEQLADTAEQAMTRFVGAAVRDQGAELNGVLVEASAAQPQPIDERSQPPCFGEFVTRVIEVYRLAAAEGRKKGHGTVGSVNAQVLDLAIDVLLDEANKFLARSRAWRAAQPPKEGT